MHPAHLRKGLSTLAVTNKFQPLSQIGAPSSLAGWLIPAGGTVKEYLVSDV